MIEYASIKFTWYEIDSSMVLYSRHWTSPRALTFSFILLLMHVLISFKHIFLGKVLYVIYSIANLVSLIRSCRWINHAYWFGSKNVLDSEVSLLMAMVRLYVRFFFLLKLSSALFPNCSDYRPLVYHLGTWGLFFRFLHVHEAFVEQFYFSMLIILHFVTSNFALLCTGAHHNDESNTAKWYLLNSYWGWVLCGWLGYK